MACEHPEDQLVAADVVGEGNGAIMKCLACGYEYLAAIVQPKENS